MATKDFPGVWVLEGFRRGGVDSDLLALEHPVEVASMLANPHDFPPRELNMLLTACAKMSGDQSFGLHMVEYVDATMMGPYGYLLAMAPTVERLLNFGELYYPTLYGGGTLKFNMHGATCFIQYDVVDNHGHSYRHLNEWTLGFFAILLAKQIGNGWSPLRAGFTNPAPADLHDLSEVFGQEVAFNAPRTFFEFGVEILPRSINPANEAFLEILIDQAEALMKKLNHGLSMVDEVRLRILENLERRKATSQEVARSMAMSRSTFKRRLAVQGLTFRRIRGEAVQQVATKALVETNTDVGTIATKLGYRELSTFDRAFKRLTGMSPTEFRRTHQDAPAEARKKTPSTT